LLPTILLVRVQFLGFLEVVRREGPRERSFLAGGNPQGSDTLATLVEGFRFVLCASPATLQVRVRDLILLHWSPAGAIFYWLATLVEGFRFVLCASPATLQVCTLSHHQGCASAVDAMA
jgi:hypothetical protein